MRFSEAFNPIRSLKSTFEAMNLAPAQLWGGGILIAFLDGCAGNSGQAGQNGQSMGMEEDVLMVLACGGCVVGLLVFVVSCWARPGVFHNLKSVLRTSEVDSQGIFDHRGQFVPMLLARLLKTLVSLVAIVVFCAPLIGVLIFTMSSGGDLGGMLFILVAIFTVLIGWPALIYIHCGMALTEEIVVFENASPVDALSRSWSLASGNRWAIILFGIVSFIFALCGLLMCCIGVLATTAITTLAWGEAYLQLSAGEESAATVDEEAMTSAYDEPERGVRLD